MDWKRLVRPFAAFVAISAAWLLAGSAFATELLYDVDFGTPPHTIGQPPETGDGPPPRDRPSEIVFGDPTVVAAFGVFTDQPCEFGNGTSGYDQLKFITSATAPGGFGVAYENYHVEMNVLIGEISGTAGNTFRMFVDLPTAHSVKFGGDNSISVYPGGVIGSYTDGVPVFLEIDVDMINDTWSISLDGTPAYSAPTTVDDLRTVRINLDGASSSDAAAIDDFKVYGDYEPTTPDHLYDVTFSTPPHTVGLPPVTGAGPAPRETPTNINFGDPTVVASAGGLPQPCAFGNGTTGYDQLQFDVGSSSANPFPQDYPRYVIECYMVVGTLVGPEPYDDYVLILDLPSVHKVEFKPDHNILATPGGGAIGTWTPGVPVHVRVELDIDAQTWDIYLDGTPAFSGAVVATELRSVRVHLTGLYANDAAALDDFKVWGVGGASSVGEDPPVARASLGRTLPPYPNPATTEATLRWQLVSPAPVEVDVLSVTGRRVWSRRIPAGIEQVRWTGIDAAGRRLPAGAYFMRVISNGRLIGRDRIILQR